MKSVSRSVVTALVLAMVAVLLGGCSSIDAIFPPTHSGIPDGLYRFADDSKQGISIMGTRIGFDVEADVYGSVRRIRRSYYTVHYQRNTHEIWVEGASNDTFYTSWILQHDWRLDGETIVATPKAGGRPLYFAFDSSAATPVWIGR